MNKEGVIFTVVETLPFRITAAAAYHDMSNTYTD